MRVQCDGTTPISQANSTPGPDGLTARRPAGCVRIRLASPHRGGTRPARAGQLTAGTAEAGRHPAEADRKGGPAVRRQGDTRRRVRHVGPLARTPVGETGHRAAPLGPRRAPVQCPWCASTRPRRPEQEPALPPTRREGRALERARSRAAQSPPRRGGSVAQPNGRSVGSAIADLAAWRRLRRSPAGGQWWGGRSLWSWDEAARSERRWSA
jgi:hypothetical protein